MKANHNSKGYSAGWRPFLGVLLAVCFLATAANADSLFTGTFTLTHPVSWDQAVLAAGQYSLTLDQSTQTIVIREAATGKTVARTFARPDYRPGSHDNSELLVTVRGEQRAVSAVKLAGLGKVFQKAHPFAGSRREVEEARNAEAIRVEMAKN
jgi:hypothetical protein